MSKWIIITVAMVIITIGIIFGALVYLLQKNDADEDAADELFLRNKSALLNNAITEQLKSGVVAVEGVKILGDTKTSQNAIDQSNSKISTALDLKQKIIDDLKKKYAQQLSEIKNK